MTTPLAGLPIPGGWCARLSNPAGPAGNSEHPLGWTPHPPRPVCPVLRFHRPCKTLRPPPGQDSPSPQAGAPGCPTPQALQEAPTTPWAGLPIPPERCARFYIPTGPAGRSDHPLGRTPHPPRPLGPVVHPRRPCRKLRLPPGLDSPSPQAGVPGATSLQALQEALTTPWAGLRIPPGRWARLSNPAGPAGNSDHPLGWTGHPPRPVCPVLRPHRPDRTLQPAPGQDFPSPQAGVPGSTSPQALQDSPTTPWAGLPIRRGRCARLSNPAGPAGNSKHPLGWTPHPPRPVCPVLRSHRPCRTLRPPPGQDSTSRQAGAPGCPTLHALQETPTTPWAGLPIPQGKCARFYLPTGPARRSDHPLGRTPRPPGRCARLSNPAGPAGNSDHPLGWTPHPPRPVCPVLRSHRPCRTLRPPPGQDSPSPQAGVPGSTSPQALQETPTTPWAGLPIAPGRCARFYVPAGPARNSDHPLGWTTHPPRPVCPVLHPHGPCRTLRPPPGQDSPSPQGRWARLSIPAGPAGHSDHPLGWTLHPPRSVCPVLRPHSPCRTLRPPPGQDSPSSQAGVPGCPYPQGLPKTPATPWAGLPIPPGRCARFYVPTGPSGRSDHPLGMTPLPPRLVGQVVHPRRPCGNFDHRLGWTPHPPRPVCTVLRPQRPRRTLGPPPG